MNARDDIAVIEIVDKPSRFWPDKDALLDAIEAEAVTRDHAVLAEAVRAWKGDEPGPMTGPGLFTKGYLYGLNQVLDLLTRADQ